MNNGAPTRVKVKRNMPNVKEVNNVNEVKTGVYIDSSVAEIDNGAEIDKLQKNLELLSKNIEYLPNNIGKNIENLQSRFNQISQLKSSLLNDHGGLGLQNNQGIVGNQDYLDILSKNLSHEVQNAAAQGSAPVPVYQSYGGGFQAPVGQAYGSTAQVPVGQAYGSTTQGSASVPVHQSYGYTVQGSASVPVHQAYGSAAQGSVGQAYGSMAQVPASVPVHQAYGSTAQVPVGQAYGSAAQGSVGQAYGSIIQALANQSYGSAAQAPVGQAYGSATQGSYPVVYDVQMSQKERINSSNLSGHNNEKIKMDPRFNEFLSNLHEEILDNILQKVDDYLSNKFIEESVSQVHGSNYYIEISDVIKYDALQSSTDVNFFILDLQLENNHNIEVITNPHDNKIYLMRIDQDRYFFENLVVSDSIASDKKISFKLNQFDPQKQVKINDFILDLDSDYKFKLDKNHLKITPNNSALVNLSELWEKIYDHGISSIAKNDLLDLFY